MLTDRRFLQHRQTGEVGRARDRRRAHPQLVEDRSIIRHRLIRVIEESAQLLPLDRRNLLLRPPLVGLELLAIAKCRSAAEPGLVERQEALTDPALVLFA